MKTKMYIAPCPWGAKPSLKRWLQHFSKHNAQAHSWKIDLEQALSKAEDGHLRVPLQHLQRHLYRAQCSACQNSSHAPRALHSTLQCKFNAEWSCIPHEQAENGATLVRFLEGALVSLIVGSPPASPARGRTPHLCSPLVILTANRPQLIERGEVMVLITLIFLPRRHDHPRTEDAEKVLSNTERDTGTGGRHQTKTWSASDKDMECFV